MAMEQIPKLKKRLTQKETRLTLKKERRRILRKRKEEQTLEKKATKSYRCK